jgi:aldehyde dehydrogenase (NAD+)
MFEFPDSQLYINGVLRPAEAGRTYENIAPTTGKPVGRAGDASKADMAAAIAAAHHAFNAGKWPTDVGFRIAALERLQAELRNSADAYRARIAAETGATIGVTRSVGLDVPIEMMTWTIDLAKKYEYRRDIDTPWAATMIGEAAALAGLPSGVLNVVTSGDKASLGEQLVTDPRIDVISFTGSTATGKRIMAAAAPGLKRIFLELGGKSANIVLDDAKFPDALYSTLAVCYHAGQGCSLPTRILLPRSRYDEAVQTIKAMYESLPFGDPASEEQILGPVASKAQFDRVSGYIRLGQEEGARLVTGGIAEHLTGGYYIKPTLFADVSNDMRIAQEEIFGPVLVAIPHDGDDDAVRIANDSLYGLGGAVQSADPERALKVALRIRTGSVNINAGNTFGADAPFGGYKQSGLGREMGVEGFEEYLQTKTVAMEAA